METVTSALNTIPRYREVGADPNRGLRMVSVTDRARESRRVDTADSVTTLRCDSSFGAAGVTFVGFFWDLRAIWRPADGFGDGRTSWKGKKEQRRSAMWRHRRSE